MPLLTVSLDETIAARLRDLAASRGQTMEELVGHAVALAVEADPPLPFLPQDKDTLEAMLAEAEAEIESGNLVDHADAMAWLRDLAAGKYRPPPKCE